MFRLLGAVVLSLALLGAPAAASESGQATTPTSAEVTVEDSGSPTVRWIAGAALLIAVLGVAVLAVNRQQPRQPTA